MLLLQFSWSRRAHINESISNLSLLGLVGLGLFLFGLLLLCLSLALLDVRALLPCHSNSENTTTR